MGDGQTAQFQLRKTYGSQFAPYVRTIAKPVVGTLHIAVNGQEVAPGTGWTLDPTTGLVTFLPAQVPVAGSLISAGFLFDVPVRFDTDYLEIDLAAFGAGDIPKIPLIEIRL
jgi:uncharacterized protein (TIGR02217 family)